MFEVGRLPAAAARLWEAATFVTGGQKAVMVSVGPEHLTIERMALLEAIFADDPPTRDDVKEWVIATAQRLGLENTELTEDGTEQNPGRMSICVPVDGLTVKIEGFWGEFPDSDTDRPGERHLRVV